MTPMKRVLIACVAITGVLVTAGQAQDWPTRPVTLVVPNAAGGPLDANARIVAPALGEALGRQVVVENRTGAGTAVGTASVARAAADGYTLLLADLTFVVGPSLIANLTYDPQRDFVPVASLSRSNLMLVVSLALAAKTAAELVAAARPGSGDLQYAHGGLGTPPHLAAIAFIRATGATIAPVAYRGSSAAVADVMEGRVPVMFLGMSLSGPHVAAGKLRALAVTGTRRAQTFPDVPTFAESGIDLGGIGGGTWFGIVAPAGTPAPIVARLNAAVTQATGAAATRAAFEASGHTVTGGTAEEFGAFLQSQQSYWRSVMQSAGLQPQ